MTDFYIDTEFNEFGGELISMAIVKDEHTYFYEVLEIEEDYKPWVSEHVVPILNKEPISLMRFRTMLATFLWDNYDGVDINIIADWPADIRYFMEVIELPHGNMLSLPPIRAMLLDIESLSYQPHNALQDALGIYRMLGNDIN